MEYHHGQRKQFPKEGSQEAQEGQEEIIRKDGKSPE
jgi:hypothetical protein